MDRPRLFPPSSLKQSPHRLRKNIANSPRVNRAVEGMFAAYVRFAFKTSRFERTGCEELDACLARGEAVITTVWHQRLILGPYMVNAPKGARVVSLTSAARAGRLAGQILVRLGWETIPMSSHQRHVTLSREVLKRHREGCSLGVVPDGPPAPARRPPPLPPRLAPPPRPRGSTGVAAVVWRSNQHGLARGRRRERRHRAEALRRSRAQSVVPK